MSVTKNNFEKPKFYSSHRSRQLSKKESIGPIKTQKTFIKDIEVNLPEDETTEPFTQITNLSDKIFLDQKLYENGVKTFLAIN